MTFLICVTREGDEQIVKVSDGITSFVPSDPANSDYQTYLAWVSEGNTPEPWEPAES